MLRSIKEMMGYRLDASDGLIGKVKDFIVDDDPWTLRYWVVDTRNWLPGRKFLVAPDWVDAIKWADRRVSVGLTQDVIKGSPEYLPSAPVNHEYETRLYDYYGRPLNR